MNILAINTASSTSRIALVNERDVLAEKSWKSENNESEKLMPEIQKMMDENSMSFADMDKILVITGPGPFTALRVSIALANALAYGLNKSIIGIPLIDLWEKTYKGTFIINAGQNRVFYKDEVVDFDEFLNNADNKNEISGELKDVQIEKLKEKSFKWKDPKLLPSFGEVILALAKNGFKDYSEREFVEPLYFSAPHITKSAKSYK